MAGTTGAIKGGMAYVQAFLDDNPLTQGLAKLQGKIKSWQASLSTMAAGTMGGQLPEPLAAIARFAQSPAGAFAALLGAAKFTAQAREEMLRLSESCGVGIEKLSALSYAARRAGVSNEALASGLKRMEGKEFLAAMQGNAGKGGMKAMTNATFAAMGKGDAADKLREFIRLTENMPTEEKIGLARRLGLSELLPLINQGIDSLDAFTARAKQLGLVMTEEDARAGKKFEQAFGDLTDVLKSSAGAIGGALVPMITGLTNMIVNIGVGIRNWIKSHQALTQTIFLVTAAVVAGGVVIKLLAVAVGILSSVLSVVLAPAYAIATVAAAIFNAVCAANPIGLVCIAIAAFVAALAALAGYIIYSSGIVGDFGRMLGQMGKDAGQAMGAVAHAIAGGDIEKAWKVVTAFLQYEWSNCLFQLGAMWDGFMDSLRDNPLIKYGMPELELLLGGKSSQSNAELNKQLDKLARLRKELAQAEAAANAVKTPDYGGQKGAAGLTPAQQGAVAGTFSGAVAGMLGGGGGIAEKHLQVSEDILSAQWRLEAAIRDGDQGLAETIRQELAGLKQSGVD